MIENFQKMRNSLIRKIRNFDSHHTRIAEIGQLGIWRKSITNTLSGSIQQKFKTLNLFFYRL